MDPKYSVVKGLHCTAEENKLMWLNMLVVC